MAQRSTADSIDDYIADFPPETRAALEEVRAVIRAAALEAVETISYAIPTFDLNGKHLVHFAGYAKHIGFYPIPSGMEAFRAELKAYKQGKGSVQFPLDRPMPADLIRRIVEFRVAENMRATAGPARSRRARRRTVAEPYSIEPYEAGHAAAVAELLADSRLRRRQRCPLLPPGLSDASTAMLRLEERGEGVVLARGDGGVAGFLFAESREDDTWGAAVVSTADMWTVSPDAGPDALAELYGAGFKPVSRGCREHRVFCPSFDGRSLRRWFRLGFGVEQAYAVTRLSEMDTDFPASDGLEIRRARAGDEDVLADLSPLIAVAQAGAPVWAGAPPAYLADLRSGFRGLTEDEEAIVLLGFLGGRPVGYQAWFPAAVDPIDGAFEGGVELSVGATVPEVRGLGVGRALTARGVAEAQAAGYSVCVTDWRTANPWASAFWPARGFEPFLYRLVRRFAEPL